MPEFKGSFEELQRIVKDCGAVGNWQATGNDGYSFRTQDGAIMNWWPKRGTINFQGKNKEAFEDLISPYIAGVPPLPTGIDAPDKIPDTPDKKIFLVHGHDQTALEQLRFILMQLGLESFILQNSGTSSNTIIEELERNINHREISFGIVLLTPDDFGYSKADGEDERQSRARQNAILEMGMVMGSLGRSRMAILKKGALEMPSDTDGMLHIPFNDHVKETVPKLVKSLENAGFKVNSSKITEILA